MQRNAAVRHIGRMTVLEMPIHVGVHETEDDGLVAHQRLVMALGIRDGLLVLAAVRHLIQDMTGFPVLVLHLFDILNPEIRNTHRQTIVEAYTAVFDSCGETRHTAHLLGNRNRFRLHFVNDLVRQRQVHQRIAVFVTAEIGRIAVEVFAQTVTAVNH